MRSWIRKSPGAYNKSPEEHFKYPEIPMFEQLEPRLLLSADVAGLQPGVPALDTSCEQAIEIDLDYQQGETIHNEPAVIETLETPSSEDPEEVLTPVITLQDDGDNNEISEDEVSLAYDIGCVTVNLEPVALSEPDIKGIYQLNAPDLPGLHLVDPDISSWNGQIIYLDFNGEENVTYNGPVTVGPFDIPAFQAPAELAGQEQEIINNVLAELEKTFAGTGIIFTTSQPSQGIEYSTIYIGGNDSAFEEYGSFLGLAEQVDTGNGDFCDEAFVFSDGLSPRQIVSAISHELGHLLGYAHVQANSKGTLERVAATITLETTWKSYPTVGNDGDEICELGTREAWFGFDVSKIPVNDKIVSASFTALMVDYGNPTQRTLWYDWDDSWILNKTDPVNKIPDELIGTVVQEGGWDFVTFNIDLSLHDWSKDLADGYVTLILTGPLSGAHRCGTVDFRGAVLKLETISSVPSVTVSVSPSSVLEDGLTNMVYTFTRNVSSSNPLTVNFSVGGTGTYIADYTQSGMASFNGTVGTVVIPAGSTTAQVIVDPMPDISVEPDDTVILTVTSGTGYTIGSPSVATGTILNDDVVVPSVTVSVSPSSVLEDGLTNMVYTFTRSASSGSSLTVNFSVGGTATYIADYTQSGMASFNGTVGTVVIPAGSTTAQVIVDPMPDISGEPDDTVILTVTSGTGYTPSGSPATGTILNDDIAVPSVTVSVSPSSVLEDGLTNMVYTFTRSASSGSSLTVNFSVGGTATYIADYTQSGMASFNGTVGTVVIPAGSTTAQVIVDPMPDISGEPDDTVILTVTSGTGYTPSGSPATGTILNDDVVVPSVTVSVSPSSVLEDGLTNMVYTFTRSVSSSNPLTVNFSVGGTGTYIADYTQSGTASFNGTSGTVVIPGGSTTAQVIVDPMPEISVEPDDTVILTVTSGTGYTVGSPSAATGTILNDDVVVPSVTVSISPSSVLEDGLTNMVYTFTRSISSSNPLTVNFSVGGTGTYVADYTQSGTASFNGTSGTIVIPTGSTTAQVIVNPRRDSSLEPDDTVILTVTSGTGYTVGSPSAATGTILDDDVVVPSVRVSVSPSSVLENGLTNMVYTFTRSDSSSNPLTVNFSVGGTGTYIADYTQSGTASFNGTAGTVVIAGGSTTAQVIVDPVPDISVEPDDTVILTVTSGTGYTYTIGSPSAATGTITDDDAVVPAVTVSVSPSSVFEDGFMNLVYMVYTFTRSASSSSALIVNFSVGGTGTYITDYIQSGASSFNGTSGTVVIPGGSTTTTVMIYPMQDSVVEIDETVILTVTSGTGYTLGSPSAATGTITNDDLPTLDFDANAKAQFTDANGDLVTVTLKGSGTGTLYFAQQGNCDIHRLILSDTNDMSSLTIKTKGNSSTTIKDISVHGSLKRIVAKTTKLLGNITVYDWVGSILMDDVDADHTITIGGSNQSKPITLKFDEVAGLTLDSKTPIKSLTATKWIGGSIVAPWISSLSIKSGDFKADVKLSGSDTRGIALNKFTVAGKITDSSILVQNGSIKKLTIKGIKGYNGDCFINSNIAAANIDTISLLRPQYANTGIPFGLAADFIKKITITDNSGRVSYKNLSSQGDSIQIEDFEISLV